LLMREVNLFRLVQILPNGSKVKYIKKNREIKINVSGDAFPENQFEFIKDMMRNILSKDIISEYYTREAGKDWSIYLIEGEYDIKEEPRVFFTSDTHFGDDRLNLYGRDLLFDTKEEIDEYIIRRWNDVVSEGDTVYHLGDVAMNEDSLKSVKRLNGKKILVKGNYDTKIKDEVLLLYFDEICDNKVLSVEKDGDELELYLNHYPVKAKADYFNIVGHIHGLWRVQRNMINVGCDAWHFTPISMEQVLFVHNAIDKFYDMNVFAGELEQNTKSK